MRLEDLLDISVGDLIGDPRQHSQQVLAEDGVGEQGHMLGDGGDTSDADYMVDCQKSLKGTYFHVIGDL